MFNFSVTAGYNQKVFFAKDRKSKQKTVQKIKYDFRFFYIAYIQRQLILHRELKCMMKKIHSQKISSTSASVLVAFQVILKSFLLKPRKPCMDFDLGKTEDPGNVCFR